MSGGDWMQEEEMVANGESQLRMLVVHARLGGFPASLTPAQLETAPKGLGV
jgi:hypothetical protein